MAAGHQINLPWILSHGKLSGVPVENHSYKALSDSKFTCERGLFFSDTVGSTLSFGAMEWCTGEALCGFGNRASLTNAAQSILPASTGINDWNSTHFFATILNGKTLPMWGN